jgi:hypothetical protein
MNILIYSRKNIYNWASNFKNYILSTNHCAEIITELTFDGDIKLGNIFNEKMQQTTTKFCVFSVYEINDIILRCRLLRSLDYELANKMVITYTNILDKLFLEKKITHFISLRVDNYFLDIVYRLSRIRSYRFIGLWKNAILKNQLFITAKGEFNFLNESNQQIIDKFEQTLLSNDFKATSIKNRNEFFTIKSLQIFLIAYIRASILFILRLYHKDYYGYRYLTTPFYVKDYKLNIKNIFSHIVFTRKWRDVLENRDVKNKLFIGLQVNPEATIDYYVNDSNLINIEKVIKKIISITQNTNIIIFIKDHPNMLGKRSFKFLTNIKKLKNVYIIPSFIDSNYVINQVNSTFTWSGTVGLQSAARGKCSIIVDSPYYHPDFYYKINTFKDLDLIPNYILNHTIKKLTKDDLSILSKRVTDSLFEGNLDFNNTINQPDTFKQILNNINV